MGKTLKFTKMQGCGNDYVYVDCFSQRVDDPAALARAIAGSPYLYMLYGALAAGVFEETGRYIAFRWLIGKRRYPERDTAVTYGKVNAALSSLAPLCRQRFAVKDCSVWTDVDFTENKSFLEFGLAMTITLWRIFGVINSILFGALKILIRSKRRRKKEKKTLEKANKNSAASEQTPVPPLKENNQTENIQDEERMAANG